MTEQGTTEQGITETEIPVQAAMGWDRPRRRTHEKASIHDGNLSFPC